MPRNAAQALGFLLGFWLALMLSPFLVEVSPADAPDEAPLAELEASLHDRVNGARAQRHLVLLRRLPELDRIARAHSRDMARRGYLSHHSPEGASPVDRLQAAAPPGFSLAAENIGKTDRGDPNREILQGWLASPEHRRNLLAPAFNTTGVGLARASDGTFVYTQVYLCYPR